MPLPKELPADIAAKIGVWGPEEASPVAVDRTYLDHWCEVFQDANPMYTDETYASRSRHKSLIAPAVACMSLGMQYAWRPPHVAAREPKPKEPWAPPYLLLRQRLGLGGAVGLYMRLDFHRVIKLGDRLRRRGRMLGLEGPKMTGAGEGYAVEQEQEHWNQDGLPVASVRLKTFIYEAGARPPEQLVHGFLPGVYTDYSGYRLPAHLADEKPVQPLVFPNPPLMLFRAASALRDWNVYHVDSEHVRAHGGVVAMYNSILFIMALFNRFATDWPGAEWDLRRLEGNIGALIHPGDTVRIEGAVARRYRVSGEERVDLAAVLRTDRWTVMPATLTVARPAP